MELTRKLFQAEIKDVDEAEGTIVSVISSKSIDRDGDVVLPKGALLDNYRKNPVVLWSHGMGGSENRPIGKNLWIKRQGNELRAKTQFDMKDEFAASIFHKFKGGFLNSWSIGFIPTQMRAPDEKDLRKDPDLASARQIISEWEMLEYSAVAVPSNPDARTLDVKSVDTVDITAQEESDDLHEKLYQAQDNIRDFFEQKTDASVPDRLDQELWEAEENIRDFLGLIDAAKTKKVIPFKAYPLAPEDTAWSGPTQIREADVDRLRSISAWFDAENPDVKGSYKLPHHLAEDKRTVLRGVQAAMGALLGARGGVDIPDADRRGVFNHLARHLREFDKEPPEFRDYDDMALKTLFDEEEPREIEVIKAYNREVSHIRQVTEVGYKRSVQLIREPIEKTVSDAVKRLKGRMI